jgi:hypothetical protein
MLEGIAGTLVLGLSGRGCQVRAGRNKLRSIGAAEKFELRLA